MLITKIITLAWLNSQKYFEYEEVIIIITLVEPAKICGIGIG